MKGTRETVAARATQPPCPREIRYRRLGKAPKLAVIAGDVSKACKDALKATGLKK